MYLSREEILKVYYAGPDAVVALVQELCSRITQLEERVARLERIIAKDSHNSHKPPSSDGYDKPQPKSRRQPSGLPPGGQQGHEGHTLRMSDHPDRIEWHRAERCRHCRRSLKEVKSSSHEKRQEFDVPPVKIEVVEHRAEIKTCPFCGHVQKADFPANIQQPVQYGPRLKSLAVYLNNYQFIPYERMSELFQDIFSFPISPGTLVNINKVCHGRLENFESAVKTQLADAKVANFDETGLRMEGKRAWLHSVSTTLLTFYGVHSKRGQEAIDDMGILPKFNGRAIHDCWTSYFDYQCEHGLCNAHLIRELIFTHEQHHQAWAKNMIDCLLDIKEAVGIRKRISNRLEKKNIKEYEIRYDRIIANGLKQNPVLKTTARQKKRGRVKQSQPKNLLDRMKNHKKEVLAFMYDFNVPFDNNLAERDIRMMKVQQKISGTFRSREGANIFCRIRSYISTVRKNGLNVLEAVRKAIDGNPFIPCLQSIDPPE
jgi:transposase